jgi:hypothetical protein
VEFKQKGKHELIRKSFQNRAIKSKKIQNVAKKSWIKFLWEDCQILAILAFITSFYTLYQTYWLEEHSVRAIVLPKIISNDQTKTFLISFFNSGNKEEIISDLSLTIVPPTKAQLSGKNDLLNGEFRILNFGVAFPKETGVSYSKKDGIKFVVLPECFQETRVMPGENKILRIGFSEKKVNRLISQFCNATFTLELDIEIISSDGKQYSKSIPFLAIGEKGFNKAECLPSLPCSIDLISEEAKVKGVYSLNKVTVSPQVSKISPII